MSNLQQKIIQKQTKILLLDKKNMNTEQTSAQRISYIVDKYYNGKVVKLAEDLGITPPALYKYLHGTRRPGSTTLERFQKIGFSADWILHGLGAPRIEQQSSSEPQLRASLVASNEDFKHYDVLVPHGYSLSLIPTKS